MMGLAGFRKVLVFESVPANEERQLDMRGNFVYAEVTNPGTTAIKFIPNDFPEHGNPAGTGKQIPIPAGETRGIPMAIYKFKATGTVTVVAYGS